MKNRTKNPSGDEPNAACPQLPGQVVLVLQGGGAMGAYQAGVYQSLNDAGIEPDWVIGTSIGAINGAIIAGNPPFSRAAALRRFWRRVETADPGTPWLSWAMPHNALANLGVFARGIPGFFAPNPVAALGMGAPVGVDRAAWYLNAPLRETLDELVDFDYLNAGGTRLTVGAVSARSGEMRYFDSRRMPLTAEHVMASGALPPAFPAVRIDGEPYWDGGIYSNTPIERVFEENPRRDSLIFAVQLWRPGDREPESILQVLSRAKDIRYASRAASLIADQQKLHRMRHVVRELGRRLPQQVRDDPQVRELLGYGCGTRMHIVRLIAPRLEGDDHNRDIDFTGHGIAARMRSGIDDARSVLADRPWCRTAADTIDGVLIHDAGAAAPGRG